MPFKMHKIIFFQKKKYVFLPYLKFSDLLPETHLFFLFGLIMQLNWLENRSECFKSIYSVGQWLIGPQRDKPVFGVSDKARFKPVSSATETS